LVEIIEITFFGARIIGFLAPLAGVARAGILESRLPVLSFRYSIIGDELGQMKIVIVENWMWQRYRLIFSPDRHFALYYSL